MPNNLSRSLSSSNSNDDIQSALGEWENTRAMLSNAIKSYQAAGITLCDTYARSSNQDTTEKVLLTINSELESLKMEERILFDTRIAFASMRNKSARLVHVNMIPHEILSIIFSMSKVYCVHDDNYRLHNLTGVCAYWRQIVKGRAELWTHIDVGPKRSIDLAIWLLERTKEAPIHVHLYEPEYTLNSSASVPGSEIPRDIAILTPHMHRVSTLDLESYCHPRTYVNKLLEFWLKNGSPSLAKALLVCEPIAEKYQYLPTLDPSSGEDMMVQSQSRNGIAMLQSVTKIHLQSARFGWKSPAWRGLVDLRLSAPWDCISVSAPLIAEILYANPNLVTLMLRRLEVTIPKDWQSPAPIELNHLKDLILSNIESGGLQCLFRLITLPNSSPDLAVGLAISPNTHDAIIEFFARCRVMMKTLHLFDENYSYLFWPLLPKLLPLCDELVLHQLYMGTTTLTVEVSDVGLSELGSFAHLPCIVLLLCTVTLETLEILVAWYDVQVLVLEGCISYGEEGTKDLEDIRASLLETYPELKCIVTEAQSSWQSFRKRVFDY